MTLEMADMCSNLLGGLRLSDFMIVVGRSRFCTAHLTITAAATAWSLGEWSVGTTDNCFSELCLVFLGPRNLYYIIYSLLILCLSLYCGGIEGVPSECTIV
jgi:hypothetical protein